MYLSLYSMQVKSVFGFNKSSHPKRPAQQQGLHRKFKFR